MVVSKLKPWCVLLSLHFWLLIASSHFMIENLPGFGQLPFTLETGYIGTGDREEVQLFYYFVESERNPIKDPFLLWLIGGPGCSGLSGFFYENGPLVFNYDDFNGIFPELKLNPNSWNKFLNILYVDAPIGTGFSYSKTQQGYHSSDKQWAEHTFDFLKKWLVDHPKFMSNPLYIGGGSYSGIAVPSIVQKAYEGYKSGSSPFQNFRGFVLASPATNTHMDDNTKIDFAHQRTLIPDELYQSMKANCNGEYVSRNPSNIACNADYEAFSELVRYVNEYQILEPTCTKESYMNQRIMFEDVKSIHQITLKCLDDKFELIELWANDPNVRKALNIIEGTKGHFQRCNDSLAHVKNVPNAVEYYLNLTKTNLRSLIYCGDLDMKVPYLSTHSMIKSFNLKLNITWRPWFIDNEVAGYIEAYTKNEYELTYVIVKGGSHVVQEYNPKPAFELMARWFSYDII